MRRIACLITILATVTLHIAPARAQGNLPPHAWLFGAWTGGLFPPPSTLSAQECLALPVVIFTRDIVMRAVITDQLFAQRLVETARVTAEGVEFRFTRPVEAPCRPVQPVTRRLKQRCRLRLLSPDYLRVQRRSENEISFPGCTDFPYPLVRCPAR